MTNTAMAGRVADQIARKMTSRIVEFAIRADEFAIRLAKDGNTHSNNFDVPQRELRISLPKSQNYDEQISRNRCWDTRKAWSHERTKSMRLLILAEHRFG